MSSILFIFLSIIIHMSTFAERLRELRQERGLSMKELAEKIQVTDGAICNWENDANEPKLTHINRLAIFFDVSSDYLIGLEDETGAKTRNLT